MSRPTWDETWMRVAHAVAERSLCSRRKVGAVIVSATNRVVSTGYNGPPAGMAWASDCSTFCPRANNKTEDYDNCVAIHAEANALLFAPRDSFEGGTIYVTHICCYSCAKLIANSGLSRVVIQFENSSRDFSNAKYLLLDSGLRVDITERLA